MQPASIAVIIFVILALSAIVTYLVIDMNRQKQELADKLNSTNAALQSEKSDRISNVKYVVDQVNEVNDDIYKSVNTSLQENKQNINTLTNSHSDLTTSLNAFMAASPTSTAYSSSVNSASVPITEYKEVINPDLRFLKRTSLTKGMTISDVDFTTSPINDVKICSKVDPSNCLRIPDAKGNTVLTSVIPGKSIVLKGNVGVNTDAASVSLHVNGDASLQYGRALHFGAENVQSWKTGTTKAVECSSDSSGNDVLSLYTPGAQSATPKLQILSSGRVGINTSKPIALLHAHLGSVNQTAFTASRIDEAGNKAAFSVSIADGQGLVSLMAGAYSDNGNQKFFGRRGASKIALHDAMIAFYTGAAVGVENQVVDWQHAATMVNGNFGVGTIDPKRKMHVSGKMWVGDVTRNDWNSSTIHVVNNTNPSIALEQFGQSTSVIANRSGTTTIGGEGAISLQTNFADPATPGNERIRIQTDGKVGVNVSTPVSTLDVGGTTTVRGTLEVGRGVGRNDANIKVGTARGADGHAFVDLVSDASTYRDFGTRLVRTPGVNANTHLMHRGTGVLEIITVDNGAIMIRTSAGATITLSGEKITINAPQDIEVVGNLTVRGSINASGTIKGGSQ